ncbi:MAG TPA: type IV secretion system protein VirB10 [Bryobacteraceae bacterium]|nr:type IV secretion system protein VirB10 [Bryobacteraceae bacterium]
MARAEAERQAQSEMLLPPLGHVAASPGTLVRVIDAPAVPVIGPAAGAPDAMAPPGAIPTDANPYVIRRDGIAPRRFEGDRRLSGPVFANADGNSTIGASASAALAATPADRMPELPSSAAVATADNPASHAGTAQEAGLPALLRSDPAAMVQATVLTGQRWILPKGAFVDCTLETAIDSTLPGMTTCVTSTDTFGVDGKVVLLERGTKLVGETRGQVQQGSARVFVIWTEARTPTGVIVPLDSPGTDELGRGGLPGAVDRHFWDRFGAAILISTIDGAIQAAVQSGARSGGTTIINPSSVQDVTTETLKSTLGIPPTVIKRNGDRIQILVARDVDFRGVYQLHIAADAR